MNKKYIIIDPEAGVFLGTAKNDELEFFDVPPGTKIVALFSSNNILEITKAVGFSKRVDAEKYIKTYLTYFAKGAFVACVEDCSDDSPYVDIIDIVRAGYGEFAWDMIDAMPMHSESLH